jgi:TPR repeat protein
LEAFELLTRAAQSMKPKPLRHLAVCYDEGRGVSLDLGMAAHLRELAELACE